MRLNELKRKVAAYGDDVHFITMRDDTKVKCKWRGCIEPVIFNQIISDEYKDFCEKYNLISTGGRYEDSGEDQVTMYPDLKKYGSYTFFSATVKKSQVKHWHTSMSDGTVIAYLMLYNDELVIPDISDVDYYYNGCALYFEEFLGMYGENLIYVGGDCIYSITPDGKVKNICPYPECSESGRVNVKLDTAKGTITVDEYVYYDNSHHHGGWESDTYNIKIAA